MNILTIENQPYNLEYVPDEIDDIRYCVLDYSNKDDVDYFFVPLVFLEIFSSPSVTLKIGKNTIRMPLDWSIVICDEEIGEPEIVPLSSISGRGFQAFTYNPLAGFMPKFDDIDVIGVYSDVKWYFPKLKFGHILSVPLESGDKPRCAFFVKDTTKVPDVLDATKLW